jgi:hypothetical protein
MAADRIAIRIGQFVRGIDTHEAQGGEVTSRVTRRLAQHRRQESAAV